ncbi:MAG: hypothetical protein KF729_08105 [Sandaracinaceae bacterium]|nr:hypothetical protein [Sandaracinaceae bacterium]
MDSLGGEALDRRVDAILGYLGEYFVGKSPLHLAAEAIARHLDDAGIDYAIAGALSLGVHGFVRATEDVDVLITREGLAQFKEQWLGRGYLNLRAGGKAVRDAVHGVKIDFLITGDYPGDGKPKPVVMPEPKSVSIAGDKYRVLGLPALIELKLASGMTAPHRMQDLTDVMRLIGVAEIPRDFALQLDPYVRDKFIELWEIAQHRDED